LSRSEEQAAETMMEVRRPDGRTAFTLGPETKVRMGQQLRVMYGEVMNEGVPDCCERLLRQLDTMDQAAE
jgi:hypothetical protein